MLRDHGRWEVSLVDLVKRFGDVVAVDGINMRCPGRVLLAARALGLRQDDHPAPDRGVRAPTEGEILLDGVDMAQTPPHKRNVNTVFQNYALFPHLTVAENVAFGLRYQDVRRRKRSAGRARRSTWCSCRASSAGARAALRRPAAAGGAGPRAGPEPRVLLLDEPLGALDAKLRKALQIELKALQQEVGITFIYVTHDQEEALTMSDRIAVMSTAGSSRSGRPRRSTRSRHRLRGRLPRRVEPDGREAGGADAGGRRQGALGEFELLAGPATSTRGAR